MQSFGIDVSKWQGNFNFKKAKDEGITFAILKAGGSDSGRYKDKKFDSYYAECQTLGIPVGAYYFGNDKNVDAAKKSAEHFVSILSGKKFNMPVYYDVEGAMLNINKTNLTAIVKAFCETVSKYGYKVGIYTSQSVFNTQVDDKQLLAYSHWVARWSSKKPTSLNSGANIDIWQFGGSQNFIRSNKVAGTVCDQDYCYVDFGQNEGKPTTVKPNSNTTNVSNKKPNVSTNTSKVSNLRTFTKTGLGTLQCPAPIPGSINFDALDWSLVFDVKFYRAKYPDLATNGRNTNELAIDHFFKHGIITDVRQGNATFNPIEYKKYNPDLADIFGNDWKWYYAHYICAGKRDGRKAI